MSNGTKVLKRDGHSEGLNLEKIHKMTEEACEGLAGVSASQVEIQSGLQFYDGITTGEIQEILVRSASDLISLEYPNYQYVASRLLLFAITNRMEPILSLLAAFSTPPPPPLPLPRVNVGPPSSLLYLNIDADEKLSEASLKIEYYVVMINYLDSILKQISNRTYQIKNSIEWHKFQAGFT